MKLFQIVKPYLSNCFLLLIPVLLWNIMFTSDLPDSFSPEIFWHDIPKWISMGENISRIAIMTLPAIMILSVKSTVQKIGLAIYLVGILIYFLTWVVLIEDPTGTWGQHALGFMAPAYTPLIWLIGIGLIGNKSFFPLRKLTLIYIALSVLFTFFHIMHAYLVYGRL